MSSYLRPYMLHSRHGGSEECAALCFAHTVQEARTTGWKGGCSWDITDEYIDLAADLITDCRWLYDEADRELFAKDEAHINDSPKSCKQCNHWGHTPIGEDELCDWCRENGYGD